MPVYHLSSPGHRTIITGATDAKGAVQSFARSVDRPIEVTCLGPEVTTVWRACKFGQRVVRWRWNQETKSA